MMRYTMKAYSVGDAKERKESETSDSLGTEMNRENGDERR